jgi:hypothetical protein
VDIATSGCRRYECGQGLAILKGFRVPRPGLIQFLKDFSTIVFELGQMIEEFEDMESL